MVREVVTAHRLEIVCLVETKIREPFQMILRQLGSKKLRSWIVKDGMGYSGKIMIGYNREIYAMYESWKGKFSLSIKLTHVRNNWQFVITAVLWPE